MMGKMPFPTAVDKAMAEERAERLDKGKLMREAKVLKFLREHPGSTAEEVFNATNVGVIGHRFIHSHRGKDGVMRWDVNEAKLHKYFDAT